MDDLHPKGTQFDDAVAAAKMMKEHGLDLADLSLGLNADEMVGPLLNDVGFMIGRGHRVRTGTGIAPSIGWPEVRDGSAPSASHDPAPGAVHGAQPPRPATMGCATPA